MYIIQGDSCASHAFVCAKVARRMYEMCVGQNLFDESGALSDNPTYISTSDDVTREHDDAQYVFELSQANVYYSPDFIDVDALTGLLQFELNSHLSKRFANTATTQQYMVMHTGTKSASCVRVNQLEFVACKKNIDSYYTETHCITATSGTHQVFEWRFYSQYSVVSDLLVARKKHGIAAAMDIWIDPWNLIRRPGLIMDFQISDFLAYARVCCPKLRLNFTSVRGYMSICSVETTADFWHGAQNHESVRFRLIKYELSDPAYKKLKENFRKAIKKSRTIQIVSDAVVVGAMTAKKQLCEYCEFFPFDLSAEALEVLLRTNMNTYEMCCMCLLLREELYICDVEFLKMGDFFEKIPDELNTDAFDKCIDEAQQINVGERVQTNDGMQSFVIGDFMFVDSIARYLISERSATDTQKIMYGSYFDI